MCTLQKVSELQAQQLTINRGHERQGLQRIQSILDTNSFVEQGKWIESRNVVDNMCDTPPIGDGVICGYGTINDQRVYIYSQDPDLQGGSLGEMHARKIAKVYEDALKIGAPVIGMIDTVGMRLQESIDAIHGYGAIFAQLAQVKGKVPTLTIIYGDCAGGASFIAGMSDFVFMVAPHAKMFLNSPHTMSEEASFDTIASAQVHLEESGLALYASEDEDEIINHVRELMSYLPLNHQEEVPCYACEDDLNRMIPSLNDFDFEKQDVETIVEAIADVGSIYPLYEAYGRSIRTYFIRLNGTTVGIIANAETTVDLKGVRKMKKLITYCDAFNIPLVTLTHVEGFKSTPETEKQGIIYEIAQMMTHLIKAQVPKVNLILSDAYGSAYIAMNSHHIGADKVYAWQTAKMGPMKSQSAARILYGEKAKDIEDFEGFLEEKQMAFEQANDVWHFASRGYIDDIIEPATTRKRLISALELLQFKCKR